MKILKTLLACAFGAAVASPALAHTKVRVYVQAHDAYYPPVVHVVPRYVQAPLYDGHQPVYYDPYWEDRRERRAQRREWRHRHGHGHSHGHRHHRGCRDHWRH